MIANNHNYDNNADAIKIENGTYSLDVPRIIPFFYEYITSL